MRILIIDNNIDPDSWGSGNLRRLCQQKVGSTVHTRRAPQQDLPGDAMEYDSIIISGSKTSAMEQAPWIARLDDLIRERVERSRPVLGVCYGHQSIARALGGLSCVRRSPAPEIGWIELETTRPSPLFASLPEKFLSFGYHFDEVAALPPGAIPFAHSRNCALQAFQIEGKPAFGIQFHPEKTFEQGQTTIERSRKTLLKDPRERARCLFQSPADHKRYSDEVGLAIFKNFLEI